MKTVGKLLIAETDLERKCPVRRIGAAHPAVVTLEEIIYHKYKLAR